MRALTGNQIKLKIRWPSILIFLVGLIVTVTSTYYFQNKHLEPNVTSTIANVDRHYKANLEYEIQTIKAALLYVINEGCNPNDSHQLRISLENQLQSSADDRAFFRLGKPAESI